MVKLILPSQGDEIDVEEGSKEYEFARTLGAAPPEGVIYYSDDELEQMSEELKKLDRTPRSLGGGIFDPRGDVSPR